MVRAEKNFPLRRVVLPSLYLQRSILRPWRTSLALRCLVAPPLHLKVRCFSTRSLHIWSILTTASVYLGWHGEENAVPPFLSLLLISWGTSRSFSPSCLLPSAESQHLCSFHWFLATQLWIAEHKLTSLYICTGSLWCGGQWKVLEFSYLNSPFCRKLNGILAVV